MSTVYYSHCMLKANKCYFSVCQINPILGDEIDDISFTKWLPLSIMYLAEDDYVQIRMSLALTERDES